MKLLVKDNYVIVDRQSFPCAMGINGIAEDKVEGDKCTPIGEFKIKKIFYRRDKLGTLNFLIPNEPITSEDGWCDDPKSKFYNQHIKFPFGQSAERLYRDDDLYDIVCVLNYNTDPIIAGKGSAIFMHVSKPNFEGTEGCIAIEREEIIKLSQKIKDSSTVIVQD
tara:strand:+ start:842 stop:1336 length:495 start_codon:yes stop_codon:yes gene_type:complete